MATVTRWGWGTDTTGWWSAHVLYTLGARGTASSGMPRGGNPGRFTPERLASPSPQGRRHSNRPPVACPPALARCSRPSRLGFRHSASPGVPPEVATPPPARVRLASSTAASPATSPLSDVNRDSASSPYAVALLNPAFVTAVSTASPVRSCRSLHDTKRLTLTVAPYLMDANLCIRKCEIYGPVPLS